ncbi:MAG TPA: ABC transporter permease, partial [Pseudonocardiaceae bacterium]|nr:ABC transporter permease [Pseudonocardiaceae bacterium]
MTARKVPAWPLIVLALPAAVSIWAGWVGLGGLTGFGVVQLLPGIWDGVRINTAITLPIGMEAYAAY